MDFLVGCVVGGVIAIGVMGIANINKKDAKIVVRCLKTNILSKLMFNLKCWKQLAEKDNLYMLGKIEAMDAAIRIVVREFDKAESEVEGE